MEGFLTVRQTAERADVAPGTVYRWLDDPDVPLNKHKTGSGRVFVPEAEVDAWIKRRNTPIVVSIAAQSPVVSGAAS